ncbi:MAG TPA: pyrroloquinoline-quinone synthase PqqC, partial [Thermodesulfobacteriota bacterium]
GRLDEAAIRTWIRNRFAYQRIIPLKDAAILSNCPVLEVRRIWIRRITDHDGVAGSPDSPNGGLEAWLLLGEAAGIPREAMLDERQVLPGVRFACEAYLNFCRQRPWIEAVAASLTELFAPDLMAVRLAAFERFYPWVEARGLRYFRNRLTQAPRDSREALDLVRRWCVTAEQQQAAVDALVFKCDLLWSMLDAIDRACADRPARAVDTAGSAA